MKRAFLGLLLLILFYNVSACAGKEADTETRQMAEDKSVSSDQSSVKTLLKNGGRLIDTAYMYGT